jgi:hypothetical protein
VFYPEHQERDQKSVWRGHEHWVLELARKGRAGYGQRPPQCGDADRSLLDVKSAHQRPELMSAWKLVQAL